MKMSSLFCSTHIVTERGRQKNRHEPQKQLTGKSSRAMLLTEESMERQVAFLVDASSQQRKPTLPARFSPCGAWPPAVRGPLRCVATARGAWHRRVTSLSLNSIADPTSSSFVCDSFFIFLPPFFCHDFADSDFYSHRSDRKLYGKKMGLYFCHASFCRYLSDNPLRCRGTATQ